MDAVDFFSIQRALLKKTRLVLEQQGKENWVRAIQEWLDALCSLRKFFEEGVPDLLRVISHLPNLTSEAALLLSQLTTPLCLFAPWGRYPYQAEDAIMAHGLAMGITPSPISASDIAMPPSSNSDVVLLPYSIEDVALPNCSAENITPPP